ncbi:MAG: M6 family metalloprotease domain-containing protein [Bacteroidales bacterium]|nr:M6 family metalloprotease domain-containing protein [Candidatus Colicola coprequi]
MRHFICQPLRAVAFIFFVVLTGVAMAIPINRTPFTHTQTDGTTIVVYPYGDESYHYFTNDQGEQLVRNEAGDFVACGNKEGIAPIEGDSPYRNYRPYRREREEKRQPRRARQIFGRDAFLAPKGLVILVEFADKKFQSSNPPTAIDSLMNGTDYHYDGATGSVRQYFTDQSLGQYTPHFEVVGPVTLPHPYKYYGANDAQGLDSNLADFVIDACLAADSLADFSEIDFDNDGYVDFVYLLYAGYGEADKHEEDLIWPCNWDLDITIEEGYSTQTTYTAKHLPQLDGKYINSYACSNCLKPDGKRAGIGSVCHEYSHVIGLPDLYDVYFGSNYDNYLTPGKWHIMDQGAYNNGGKTPPSFSPWDKYFLGWAAPTLLATSSNDTLPADGKTYRYMVADGTSQETTSEQKVYYLENRQKTGWDAYAPGHGMLVWRVQYDFIIWAVNEPNASESKEYGKPMANVHGNVNYTLIPAAGDLRSQSASLNAQSSTPFPGNMNVHSCNILEAYPLTDIEENDGVITYRVKGGETTAITTTTTGTTTETMKLIRNGQLVIIRNGKEYNAQGGRRD